MLTLAQYGSRQPSIRALAPLHMFVRRLAPKDKTGPQEPGRLCTKSPQGLRKHSSKLAMKKTPARGIGIGAVVRLTGLSQHVIRIWERRHGAVKPARTPSKARRYSEAEVERLKLLRDAVGAGHRIGAIAGLSDHEIKALLPEIPSYDQSSMLRRMLDATRSFDRSRLEQLMTREMLNLGPFDFFRLIVVPFFDLIDSELSDTESCIAEEHLASATIRGILMSLLRFETDNASGPTILFSTLPGEHHELGALAAAICAQQAGARSLHLGPDLPVSELAMSARRSTADIIVLSGANSIGEAALADLEELRRTVPRRVAIWVGGRGWTNIKAPPGVRFLATLNDLRQQVHRYANRT